MNRITAVAATLAISATVTGTAFAQATTRFVATAVLVAFMSVTCHDE